MNVIVSNRNEVLLSTLNIEVIKNINGVFEVDELASQFQNFFYNKMIIDITAIKDYENIASIQRLSLSLDGSKIILLLDDSPIVNSPLFLSQLVSMGIYNFTKDIKAIPFLINNPNQYKDVASYQVLNASAEQLEDLQKGPGKNENVIGQRIIGIKNLTEHAGASTFSFLLKKHIEAQYTVKAVELNKNDLELLNENDVVSMTSIEFDNFVNNSKDTEVLVVDLNDSGKEEKCSEVLYLIEPGLIPLNKLVASNNEVFIQLKGEKIILNKSTMSKREVEDFERESGSKIFFDVPYVSDQNFDNKDFIDLIIALGLTRFSTDKPKDEKKGFKLFN